MKHLLPCLLLLGISYAQSVALPDSIREIPPLPEVEIHAVGGNSCCSPLIDPIERYDTRFRRKYDTYNELIFMIQSDVWMADPSARTGRD